MRLTLSLSVASEMCPAFTPAITFSGTSQPSLLPAACVEGRSSQGFIGGPPGISRSMPAFTVGAVEYVLPQSEITNPLKPNSFFSTSLSRYMLSAQCTPFTLLYADITDQA